MTRSIALAFALAVAVAVTACGRSAPSSGSGSDHPPPPAGRDAAATTVASTAPADAAVATPPTPPTPPAPTPDAGPPPTRGDYCERDADCGWDDPCDATRCIDSDQAGPGNCEKSRPPPGSCECVEQQCTLRPSDPALGASDPGCTSDDECAIDVGAARCHLRGDTLIGPIDQEGPMCTCDRATTRCMWTYVGPVACKTWKDCSWIRTPRLRPAPSSLVPRPFPRPVRACKDGEIDSVCKDSVCEIVGWSC